MIQEYPKDSMQRQMDRMNSMFTHSRSSDVESLSWTNPTFEPREREFHEIDIDTSELVTELERVTNERETTSLSNGSTFEYMRTDE